MTSSPRRVGLVGFGLAGKQLHRPLLLAAGFTITAVVTRDASALAIFAPGATAVPRSAEYWWLHCFLVHNNGADVFVRWLPVAWCGRVNVIFGSLVSLRVSVFNQPPPLFPLLANECILPYLLPCFVATVVGSIEALLARDDVDVVVVASPSHLHVAHATAAVHSGRHVVVDKPFAGVCRTRGSGWLTVVFQGVLRCGCDDGSAGLARPRRCNAG